MGGSGAMQGDGGEEGSRNGGIGDVGDEKRAKKGVQFGSEVRGDAATGER